MVEQKDGTQDHPLTIINILPVQHVMAFQELAGEFDV